MIANWRAEQYLLGCLKAGGRNGDMWHLGAPAILSQISHSCREASQTLVLVPWDRRPWAIVAPRSVRPGPYILALTARCAG